MADEKSLDEIMSREPAGGDSSPEAPVSDRARDEQGRFTKGDRSGDDPSFHSESAAPAPSAAPAAPEPPPGFIPIQAMDARLAKAEERAAALMEQNAALMRQMQQFIPKQEQTKQALPDFFDNPDAAFEHRIKQALEPISKQTQEVREQFSQMLAIEKFGMETVNGAYLALESRMQQLGPNGPSDPVYRRVMGSPHPFGELVKWHKEQSALAKYGDDPEAFMEAEIQRRLAARGQPANPPSQKAVGNGVMPSDFTGSTTTGPRGTVTTSGPRPLSEIMGR